MNEKKVLSFSLHTAGSKQKILFWQESKNLNSSINGLINQAKRSNGHLLVLNAPLSVLLLSLAIATQKGHQPYYLVAIFTTGNLL